MSQPDYLKTHSELTAERYKLTDERTSLETQLNEINNKISHLDEALRHLAPLAGMTDSQGSITGLGITDAIRTVLRNASRIEGGERMTASDIRRTLNEKGFDFSGMSQPMASIYKILSRLVDDSQEVERERIELEEGGIRTVFWWKITEPEISDEEVPF